MTKTHTITIKSLDDLFKLSSQDLKKVLDKFGIKDERGSLSKLFSKDRRTEELKTVLNKIKYNQEIYGKLTWQGKLAVLLDFNNDTYLDSKVHNVVKEFNLFEAIDSKQKFDNLLKNLGYK
jgi:hypothetical protein